MKFNTSHLEAWGTGGPGRFDLQSVRGKELRCTMVLLHQQPAYQIVCDADRSVMSRPMHAGAAWLLTQCLNSMFSEPQSSVVSPEEYEYDYVRYCLEKRNEAEAQLREVDSRVWRSAASVSAYLGNPELVSALAACKAAGGALVAATRHYEEVTGFPLGVL